MLGGQASQTPTRHVAPERSKTYGDVAAQFAADYGLVPDPWQQFILDDWLGEQDGRWSSLRCGLAVPRQNGKNAALEVRELFGAVGLGEKILHSAHEVKTAQKHFKRLKFFFGTRRDDPGANFPELNALVAEVRNVNGQEAVLLRNGGSIEIIARSKSSGRGFTVDVLVMDEAQELDDDAMEALLSTTASAPLRNPQWIFTGTPPGPRARGEVFTRLREDALGSGSRIVWHEWSSPADVDLDDRAATERVNPGLLTGRLQWSVIEGERGSLSDEGFARERHGVWSDSASRGVVPAHAWAAQVDDMSVAVDRFALGVECGPDLSWASVVLAGQRSDGGWHVELEQDQHTMGRGTGWLVPHLQSLIAANPQVRSLVVDVAGPVQALLEQRGQRWFFRGSQLVVQPVKVSELGTGCALFLDGVMSGWLHHIGQPQLSVAALSASRRKLADTGMWVWSRRSAESDITPVQAATLALIGAQANKTRRPSRADQTRKVVVYS